MKPLIRGHIHQIAFYISLCACAFLLTQSYGSRAFTSVFIYCLSLAGLFGISALYHCPMWSRKSYLFLRRVDHAAIFALIAGTATPICLVALNNEIGHRLLWMMWIAAGMGMLMAMFWTHGPKWFRSIFYVIAGWLAILYFSEITSAIGMENMWLLVAGGIVYTIGALVYAFKWPDPIPHIFGYHEIFHLFVVIASGLHFWVIYRLISSV
jgi:hemolysin III